MTKHRKQIYRLLQTSQDFLENPEDEGKWGAFQKALENVEALEKAESVSIQPQNFTNPTPETDQLVRRYYEERLRPRNRFLLWGILILILVFGAVLFGDRRFSLDVLAAPTATATYTATRSNTSTPTALPILIEPSPTLTAITTTASPTITPSNAPTVIAVLSPTLSPTFSATPIPFFANEQIADQLTSDRLAMQYHFQGRSGDVITLRVTSSEFDPYLAILDTNGMQIAADDDCGSLDKACVDSIELSTDGTYSVVVDSFTRRDTGAYTLDITVTHSVSSTMTPNAVIACTLEMPRLVIVTKQSSVNLRAGAGQSYDVTGFAYNGECFAIMARNATDTWFQIRTTSGRTAWIAANLAEIQGQLDDVPVTK